MQKRVVSYLFIILFSLLITSCQQDKPVQNTVDIPLDPTVRTGKLENGLTYYIKYNPKPLNRAEFRLAVNAGSNQEDEDQQGLAHFTEHMAFNGSEHFSKNELIDYLESIGTKFGAHLNAYTSFDETVYMFKIPTDSPDIVNKGYQILSDWAGGLSFDHEEIDKERGVVGEEWRLRLGANERMRRKYWPVLFHNSRYAERMPIGKKEVIDTANYEAFKRYYRDWYRPDLMAVLVVGDINIDSTEKKIIQHFSHLKSLENKREKELYNIPDHKDAKAVVATDKEASYTLVKIMYKQDKKKIKTEEDYRSSLIRKLYTNMISSRLKELKLQEDPPFSFAYAYYGGFARTKDNYVSVAFIEEDEVARSINTLLTENERVRQHGYTQTELEREKKSMLRKMEKRFKETGKTDSRDIIGSYVYHFLNGNAVAGVEQDLALHEKYLPGITLNEINQLATEWITDGNYVIVVTAPEKEDLKLPTEEELLTLANNIKTTKIEPYIDNTNDADLLPSAPESGSITKETQFEALGITEWKLSNGVKVLLKPTDFKNDEVLIEAFSYGGASLYPAEDDLSASYASVIMTQSGVGTFNRIQLDKKLAGKIVNVYPVNGETFEGFRGNTSTEDLNTAMQLIHLYFTQPRKDEVAFKSFIDEQKGFIENNTAWPDKTLYDTIDHVLYNKHPRRLPMSLERLGELDLDKTYGIYKDRFADASDFNFFFVGNFTLEAIKPMVEKYLANLPSTNRSESWKDMKLNYTKGKIEKTVYKGIEPKSRVNLIFTGDYEWNGENKFKIDAMVKVLSIKLRETLREDMGGVYGVGVYPILSHYPKETYRLTISFGCDPENTEALIAAAEKEIRQLQNNEPEAIDMTKAKQTMIRSRETDLNENRFWLKLIKESYFHQEGLPDLTKFNEQVEALTGKEIQETTQKYFNFDNYFKAVLYPKKEM